MNFPIRIEKAQGQRPCQSLASVTLPYSFTKTRLHQERFVKDVLTLLGELSKIIDHILSHTTISRNSSEQLQVRNLNLFSKPNNWRKWGNDFKGQLFSFPRKLKFFMWSNFCNQEIF